LGSSEIGLAASSLGSLGIIFLVLIGATLGVRRLRGTAWAQRATAQTAIKVISSRPLGGQNTLVIAEAEGQRFLIGVSRHGISAIGRLDGHE
jgi:flagellar biogenesis protein FliO